MSYNIKGCHLQISPNDYIYKFVYIQSSHVHVLFTEKVERKKKLKKLSMTYSGKTLMKMYTLSDLIRQIENV